MSQNSHILHISNHDHLAFLMVFNLDPIIIPSPFLQYGNANNL